MAAVAILKKRKIVIS